MPNDPDQVQAIRIVVSSTLSPRLPELRPHGLTRTVVTRCCSNPTVPSGTPSEQATCRVERIQTNCPCGAQGIVCT